ncbi:cell division protein FtsL [Paenibacillus sp. GCM10012307]|uniref:Cell division protein FtsL n=1 Tax=Paenibacillus roseus TaxID=2798579 RepID=A0A934J5C3_9BACL|nr:cell division protein FtsL [Paenibacillus roseus]MBJ6363150.1 cell division protein FtsL [Paenibacillus roseus]
MAYMHGNLALKPKKQPEQPRVQRKQTVVRRKSIPVQEKLLYLFTILVCVFVAGAIIFRYAQIYQINLDIKELNRQQVEMSADIKELQKQVEQLSDPEVIRKKAMDQGMVQSEEPITVKVN